MSEDDFLDDPVQTTIKDVFRVVNELRKTTESIRMEQQAIRADQHAIRADQHAIRADQQAMRLEQEAMRLEQQVMRVEISDFRASTEERFDDLNRRLGSQTESALNVALHVLGEQRGKLRELIDWANTKGASIERLP